MTAFAQNLVAQLVGRLFTRDRIVVAGSISVFLLLELLILFPGLWWLWILFVVSSAVLSSVVLTNFSIPVPGWWHTLFSPGLFVFSASFLVLFLNSSVSRHLTVIVASALLALFWENIRRYYWDLSNYHPESLENVSLGINIFIVWFISSTLYHALLDLALVQQYTSWAVLFAVFLMVLVVYLVDYRTIWVQRYSQQKVWLLLVSQAILVGELFWVLNFLPNSIQVKSFFVALMYYFLVSLGRAHLDGNLNQVIMRRYTYYGLAFLLLVLVTSRWLV